MNVRDGVNNARIDTNDPTNQDRGLHEPYSNYEKCAVRERNKGLWTADQDLNNRNEARFTRQDRNGNRYGFECNEEKDYYPYWHPTVWKDIAVLTTDPERCEWYKAESQNVKPKNECSDPEHNNERACVTSGADWLVVPEHKLDPPVCTHAPWLRDNHLGNGQGGRQTMFNWTIPDEVSSACVLRMRYNISTMEVDWDLDSRYNMGQSPIKTNPRVDVGFGVDGGDQSQLELAVNTNQYGRTFQDRSHLFEIIPRPKGIKEDEKIYNLNVRGKRGNIVQAYPAVEYDFSPKVMSVSPGSWVHFQWTGNDDTNNNGGNNGEGIDGTDRHNLVQIKDPAANVPLHKEDTTLFNDAQEMTVDGVRGERSREQLIKEFALVKQTGCAAANTDPGDQDPNNCEKLNAAAATIDLGLLKLKEGHYHFMSTRNNNFSNRSQKGAIHVQKNLPPAPSVATAAPEGVDGLRVSWGMPAATTAEGAIDATEPEEVLEYRLEMTDDGGASWSEVATFSSDHNAASFESRTYLLRRLPAGVVHAFRVHAKNKDGWSEASTSYPVMTADSVDSLRYKALLRNAVVRHKYDNLGIELGVSLGAVFIFICCAVWHWHKHGTIVPSVCVRIFRICRRGNAEPLEESSMLARPANAELKA